MSWVRVKQVATFLLVVTAAGMLALAALRDLPFVAVAESWLADFRIAANAPPEPQHPDILVVLVTEETLRGLPYRSPVDRDLLADLLSDLDRRDVRAIGVDLLFDRPTEPAKDARLKAVIAGIKAPLVLGYGDAGARLDPEQIAYLDGFVPPPMRGFTDLELDPLRGTTVGVYPGRALADGSFVPGMARAIAGKLGVAAPLRPTPLAWRSGPSPAESPFAVVPAQAVAHLPDAALRGKIVLIGTDLGPADRRRSPQDLAAGRGQGSTPMVTIQAHALAQLLDGRQGPVLIPEETAALTFAVALVGALMALGEGSAILRMVLAGSFLTAGWWYGFRVFDPQQALLPLITPTIAFGLALVISDMLLRGDERRRRAFIQHAFGQYLSPSLVDQLAADPASFKLGGERREMTFLFTDVAGFTALAEGLDPGDLATLLNAYLDGVCKAILAHGGTINDFLGDAVCALFGAPLEQPDHTQRAVACALEIDRFAEDFRQSHAGFGLTRIGLHSGFATVGNMGSERRFKYTPVGDAVNIGSRMEGLNKHFGTRICASEAVVSRCPDLPCRPIALVTVAGRGESLAVYELGAAPPGYLEAHARLAAGDPAPMEAYAAAHPEDPVAAFHLRRIGEGLHHIHITMAEK